MVQSTIIPSFYGRNSTPDFPQNVGAEVATFNPEDDPTGTDCKALQGYPIFFEFINAVMDHF
ncbi:hypothetical protein PENANT_c003G08440 [Penicillium antarcticum]|uniref:Uncharacterized protein n=1 Tax=Penicillium antarcticum TaxID=416450 RepID=A0A1V6QI93_9EURO|nr:hypothetical protein PENANT_c003G08440 [Penicillium antarcticum]